jgi:hypothetical protein
MTPLEGDVSAVPRSPSGSYSKLLTRHDGPFYLVLSENAASEELCVERHGVDVLPVRRGQRGRRAHGADLHFGIMKELRQRLDLSCQRARVPILGLIDDAGKAHRHCRPGRLPVDGPQGCREAFLVCRRRRPTATIARRACRSSEWRILHVF